MATMLESTTESTRRIQAVSPSEAAIPAAAGHAHHWVIEEAHGLESRGVCKYCGAVKDFRNWIEETDFITNEEHRAAA